jgi:hypothetical protein
MHQLFDIQSKLGSGTERLKSGLVSLQRQKAQLTEGLRAVEQKEQEIDAWMLANQSTAVSAW